MMLKRKVFLAKLTFQLLKFNHNLPSMYFHRLFSLDPFFKAIQMNATDTACALARRN